MDYSIYLLFAALILCFLMTWGVGANDLANVMSTTMGSKAVTVRQAMLIAIIFEFAGAFLGGEGVTETMRDGIINTSQLSNEPLILIEGMLCVLFACTIWMNLASYLGVPVSITNALVGSMVGFGTIVLGPDAIHWNQVARIAIGWVSSPLISGITAYALFISIQQTIFVKSNPLTKAKLYIPIYLFLIGFILSFITVFKGLNHFDIHLNLKQDLAVTLATSIVITILGMIFIKRIPEYHKIRRRERFIQVEKYFAVLMAMTACAMAFAHGSNDVALAVGPLSIVHSLVMHSNQIFDADNYPSWIILLGCLGVVIGFLMYGRKVIETVGSSITALTPSRAFAATLSAATTVVVATSTGIPVSATQTLVGAVLGVGLARGIGALNLIVIRNIFMSWVLTLPAASILTILSYKLLHALLG
ncbi:inorganic phosphate transporter [Legionella pneumophila]|uniref:Phosphate transporter n=1 Tax=Legionella pneumophila subsp. pascullei TaxID=91890 RepID=A0AAX2IUD4_LEGPN|nr:inorganic phosphate transporter [Legionella pneumophila]MDW8880362.1 inorganic phosphate transporter [Legionella pneumophila subsp. fraseri]AMP90690.1 phosphate permease [Legionella pneumophila subsp. pascullei]AMP91620.1 phosphate permease [Legionella pneumophila subsp. pascullei]AMP94606.1 phosphate permease [Legionella pneumophila subsp. pascullei]MDW8963470.1 inorganic phosphate transporter [Legionella pneumophila subsp. fraseri]